jgi:hypothetical protein
LSVPHHAIFGGFAAKVKAADTGLDACIVAVIRMGALLPDAATFAIVFP